MERRPILNCNSTMFRILFFYGAQFLLLILLWTLDCLNFILEAMNLLAVFFYLALCG